MYHNETFPVKLSKIVYNKFIKLKSVEINFNKFTSINGKTNSIPALTILVEGIKFVLNCSDLEPENLCYTCEDDDSMEVDDITPSFVEAHIIGLNGKTQAFKKSILNDDFFYEIDGLVVTMDEYMKQLTATNIISPSLNTLAINPSCVNKVTMQSDRKRSIFIEFFCGSKAVVSSYDQLLSLISKAKIRLNKSMNFKKNLMTDKKKLKRDLELTEKRSELIEEFNEKAKQFDIFRIYHNNKFLDSAFAGIVALEGDLENLKAQKADLLTLLNEDAEFEALLNNEKHELKIKLDNTLGDRQHSQKTLEIKAKIEGLKFENVFENELQKFSEHSQDLIDKALEEIQDLQNQYENSFDLDHEKFLELQEDFELKNRDELLTISALKEVVAQDEEESFKASIKRHRKASQKERIKISSINQQISELNKKLNDQTILLNKIKQRQLEVQKLKHSLDELENFNDMEEDPEKLRTLARKKVLVELRKHFPGKIFGRLSDLCSLAENSVNVDKDFIYHRLGKYSEVIIVDSVETAEKCVDHVRAMLGPHEEIFLPLSMCTEQKSTKSFLPDGNLPTAMKCSDIESLIEVNQETVKNAALFCLNPSLVFESLKDAESCLLWSGARKLDVVSIEANTCFKKNGFLERTEKAVLFNIEQREEDLLEIREQYLEAKSELVLINPELILHQREINRLNKLIKDLQASRILRHNIFDYHETKIIEIQMKLQEIETDKMRSEQVKFLKSKEEALNIKKAAHYEEFCSIVGDEKIGEIKKNCQELLTPEVVAMKTAMIHGEVDKLENDKAEIQSMLQSKSNEENFEIEELALEVSIRKEKIQEIVEDVIMKDQEYFRLKTEINKNMKIDTELLQKICDNYEKIYNDLHHIQMCFKENFSILTSNYMEHNSLPLSAGSMENFLIPPDNVSENFHLIRDQFKKVEVSSDELRDDLKEDILDVVDKTHELTKRLEILKKKIENTSGKISAEVNKQRVRQITEGMVEVDRVLRIQQGNVDRINEKLQAVQVERKRIFSEILESLNAGIAEFCRLAFEGNVVASLKPTNSTEPYLGGVEYYWRTVHDGDNKVTAFKPNYESSLALLFAILKFKKQKFVVVEDATRRISNDIEKFFQQQNFIQIFSLTSRVSDDASNFMIRPKAQSFTVKRIQ